MAKLLVNKVTAAHMKDLAASDAAVILISGATGSGKSEIASALAEKILGSATESLVNKGQLFVIDGNSAGIEDVRGIIKRISIKSSEQRIFLIKNVDGLGHEAQNALLKTLEQLPPTTRFIMTTTHPEAVLPTIRSRAASFSVRPVSLAEAKKFYGEQANEIEKYWSMSGGLAGELKQLIKNDSPLDAAISDAKEFLSLGNYERLIFIDKYAANRENLQLFSNALLRILKAATPGAAEKNQANLKRLVKARKTLMDLTLALSANASTKLVALKLATSLEV